MNKILLISGHPDLRASTANRLILEQLANIPDIDICDIRGTYPDGHIDVQAEQDRLRKASLVILQFPFIWYGMPSHMRKWMEEVFAQGFAFGEGGVELRNKQLLLSVTLGGSMDAYSSTGQHQHLVQTFLKPLEMFVKYCGMTYLPPVYSYSMVQGNADDGNCLSKKISRHAQRIEQVIHCLAD